MMAEDDVLGSLCSKDQRNPGWSDLFGYDEELSALDPRIDCSCDNCFYGRDRLALEILRLREKSSRESKESTLYSLLSDLLPDMEARVKGLQNLYPGRETLTALHRNESLLRRIKDALVI